MPELRALMVVIGVLALVGCATQPKLPERSLMLGEVAHVANRDEILRGVRLDPDKIPPVRHLGAACGMGDADIVDGSFVVVRYHFYWYNQSSGVVHHGVTWAAAHQDRPLKPGNIVEVEILAGKEDPDRQCLSIHRVRFDQLAGSGCEYRPNPRNPLGKALEAVSPVGAPGSQSLVCPGLAAEGWRPLLVSYPDALIWTRLPPGTSITR